MGVSGRSRPQRRCEDAVVDQIIGADTCRSEPRRSGRQTSHPRRRDTEARRRRVPRHAGSPLGPAGDGLDKADQRSATASIRLTIRASPLATNRAPATRAIPRKGPYRRAPLARGLSCFWAGGAYHPRMPTKAQIEFFARWNEAARRAERAADFDAAMARRLSEAARLSAVASGLAGAVSLARPRRRARAFARLRC